MEYTPDQPAVSVPVLTRSADVLSTQMVVLHARPPAHQLQVQRPAALPRPLPTAHSVISILV
ncbi:hypothetical protein DPMN_009739 [Dreissena polymorpha]|uniref:Uncharacterized protein n=1 Tax=Dreissena polymorpha TaxID=45954 RepID=A0A9D4MXI1_DREPO|nr:hypothetical protein DPMN_009739 [Dreissena polymorpha]